MFFLSSAITRYPMKNFAILLIGVALSHGSLAQKCKYTINKKDAFTGEQVYAIAHNNHGWIWTSVKQGDKFFIDMTFIHAGNLQKPMATSDSVLVKLADGTLLRLKPFAEVQPVSQNETFGATRSTATRAANPGTVVELTAYSPRFLVDRTSYERLSNSGMTAIRIDFTGKPYDLDFTARPLSKSVEDIMNNAKCILSLN